MSLPVKPVAVVRLTVAQAVEEIVKEANVSLPEPRLEKRFELMIEERLRDVRTDIQTKQAFMKDLKIGGLSFSDSEAGRMIQIIKDKLSYAFVDRSGSISVGASEMIKLPVAALPRQSAAPGASLKVTVAHGPFGPTMITGGTVARAEEHAQYQHHVPPSPTKGSDDSNFLLDEEDEIRNARAGASTGTSVTAAKLPDHLGDLADEIFVFSAVHFSQPTLDDRFRNIILSRLREVRSAAVTKEILVRAVASGGLGFNTETAERVSALIEKKFDDVQERFAVETQEKLMKWKRSSAARAAQLTVAAEKREEHHREKIYKRFAGSVLLKPAREAPPLLPAAPAVLELASHAPPPREARLIPTPTLQKKIIPAAPVAPPPRKLSDVREPPKLVGPMDELRSMTIADFRRISRDPEIACSKIKNRIDFAGSEGPGQRFEARRAFMESEVARAYRDILTAAFRSGADLTTTINARGAGREGLTAVEFAAVGALMKLLRF